MLVKTRAIVLHSVKYGETSLIVQLYSEQYGRISGMASGVRAKKSRFPMTLFQPLTLLEAELYYKAGRSVHRFREVDCPFPYQSLPFSVSKSTVSLFLAEVLSVTLQEEMGSPDLFDFLYHAFQYFDTHTGNLVNFHLLFLIQYARYLGFFPARVESRADLADMPVFSDLTGELFKSFIQLTHYSILQTNEINLSYEMRVQLLDRILGHYTRHMEGMGRLKSLPVLKAVFTE